MIVNLDSDGDDLILPIPNELIESLGWKEGDHLTWTDNGNHTWVLSKVNEDGKSND